MKSLLALDFDGVLHSYTSGWKGAEVIPDPPVPGAMQFIRDCLPHFDVQIFSTRSNEPAGVAAMQEWFHIHLGDEAAQLVYPTQKPPAFVTIDDRALTFDGTWPTVESLKAFKPWNKK
jgi:hypothetical protein